VAVVIPASVRVAQFWFENGSVLGRIEESVFEESSLHNVIPPRIVNFLGKR
jgi:hypothetical protein